MQYKKLLNDLSEANRKAGREWDTGTVRGRCVTLSKEASVAITSLEEELEYTQELLGFWKQTAERLMKET